MENIAVDAQNTQSILSMIILMTSPFDIELVQLKKVNIKVV